MLLLMATIQVSAQDYYYIRFTDKNNSRFSINKPEEFLSPRSIERRRVQHIAIQENDLPLSLTYTTAISSLADRFLYSLKWDNALLVRSADPLFADKIRAFPFVKSISRISGSGASTVHKKLDAVDESKALTIRPIDTSFYGASSNQNAMIHINALHQKGYWGDGVMLAVMDAGFANVNKNVFFSKVYDENRLLYTRNYVYDTSYVYAYDSHGAETFSDIAANIPHKMVGTSPNAQFLLFVTEDARSERIIEEYNWASAAEVADSIGADVFSTSLGYEKFDAVDSIYNTTYATLNGHSTPIAIAANTAASKGILVINSAGNSGGDSWHYISTPADGDSVVAIGAVKYDGTITSFSGRGPNSAGLLKPNVCAQGQAAAVVLPNGTTSASNGTSFSCPIMAGAFACLRGAFPSAPNITIINAVQRSSNFYNNPNDDYGYGIPDFGLAYDYLKALYPTDTLASIQSIVYPNPFTTSIRLNIAGLLNAPITVELFDLSGRKIWTTTLPEDTYKLDSITLTPPAYLAVGSYILRINGIYKLKLIKQP